MQQVLQEPEARARSPVADDAALTVDPQASGADSPASAPTAAEFVPTGKLGDVNSYLFSAVCHLLVLILLAFWTMAAKSSWQGISLLAQESPGYDGPSGDELDLESAVQFEVTEPESSTAAGPVKLFEFSAATASDLASPDQLLNVSNNASGLDGLGVGPGGEGLGGPHSYAEFFGIGGSGQSFVYVVDCSSSMNEAGKWDRAKVELLRSIEKLSSEQNYFVIFYNDGAYPMDADEPQPVTPEEVKRVNNWVRQIEPVGGTNPLPALLYALELKPDAIFFLSDGLFDPAAIQVLKKENRARSGRVPIHTISFVNIETQGLMKTIARHSGGEFRFVP